MNESKKRFNMIIAIFCVFVLVALSLLSLVCYLSFDQNYREIKQQYYSAITGQVISDMETSIQYGKRIDRYFGIETLFERTKSLLDEEFEVAVADKSGAILYKSYEDSNPLSAILTGNDVVSAVKEMTVDSGYSLVTRGGYEVLLQGVEDESGQIAGSFLLAYPDSVYAAQRNAMLRQTGIYLAIALVLALASLLIYWLALRNSLEKGSARMRQVRMFVIPTVIIMVFIVLQGVLCFILFQEQYEGALHEDALGIVNYVKQTTEGLYEKGVRYEEMYGLSEYLADKVQNVPVLWNLRVSLVLSDADTILSRGNSAFLSIPVDGISEQTPCIEAFISEEYVQEKMLGLFFMFFATFIFCAVIIMELTKLPALIDQRRQKNFGEENEESYVQITSGLRIASFLRTMSNYLYLPYSAMLIRQWNQAVGPLSVGMTAALPLTLESAGQVLGIMLYPIWFKKPNRATRWFFMGCVLTMIAVNVWCFMTESALVIILMRLIGGFAYSGFMHLLNMIVAAGNDSEERRQVNLAQSNAGVIGGIMCGAGVGAIIAALAGYAASYLISAVLFAFFGIFVLKMLPWKLLERNAEKEEARLAGQEGKSRVSIVDYVKTIFAPQVLQYFLLVIVPVNFGILYVVTLIPAMVDAQGSTILLSYCYIVNGMAGFYLGPKLVSLLGNRLGYNRCIMVSLIIAAIGLFVLNVPPFLAMVLLSSTLLGLFDGFGTPMATDGFLSLRPVKERLPEVTSLSIYFMLCNVVTVVAPMLIELMTQGSTTISIYGLTIAYVGCALLFALLSGISSKLRKGKGAAA